uniref:Glycogen debranching enzyme central domain-containing protein n=1 Tax=Plectus sambesii TaxID=2011161 RepID=A0A914V688_9BILA
MVEVTHTGGEENDAFDIELKNFPPGSVIAFRVSLTSSSRAAIALMRQNLTLFGFKMRSMSGSNLRQSDKDAGLKAILSRMSLSALNRALFRCHEEEADEHHGNGAYDIPRYGRFVYCGLQGLIPLLNDVRVNNDLGHPLCDNLRRGVWLGE